MRLEGAIDLPSCRIGCKRLSSKSKLRGFGSSHGLQAVVPAVEGVVTLPANEKAVCLRIPETNGCIALTPEPKPSFEAANV